MSDRTDFSPLGEMEIENAGDIFKGCELIREVGSNSGLIIAQWANDVEWALAGVPLLEQGWGDNPAKRARRVARHAHRAAESLRAATRSAAKLPEVYLQTYADVIQQRKPRRKFDPKAGL